MIQIQPEYPEQVVNVQSKTYLPWTTNCAAGRDSGMNSTSSLYLAYIPFQYQILMVMPVVFVKICKICDRKIKKTRK